MSHWTVCTSFRTGSSVSRDSTCHVASVMRTISPSSRKNDVTRIGQERRDIRSNEMLAHAHAEDQGADMRAERMVPGSSGQITATAYAPWA